MSDKYTILWSFTLLFKLLLIIGKQISQDKEYLLRLDQLEGEANRFLHKEKEEYIEEPI
mgnify:CR=1 FL=1